MKRLEVYYTDVEDIQSLVKKHYDYDYDYNDEDIPGGPEGTRLIDMDKASLLSAYMAKNAIITRQEIIDNQSGTQHIDDILRVLVEDGYLKPAHYLIQGL
jgi:hypothetical protein